MNKTCPCATPPGGAITCREDQLAICGILDGQVVSGCFDQPLSVRFTFGRISKIQAIRNWTLSTISRTRRSARQRITPEEEYILASQLYESPDGKTSVRFSIPSEAEAESGSEASMGA